MEPAKMSKRSIVFEMTDMFDRISRGQDLTLRWLAFPLLGKTYQENLDSWNARSEILERNR